MAAQAFDDSGVSLGSEFARTFPELGVPAQAVRPELPSLVIVNEQLAGELELDARWLRRQSGVRFLLGNDLPVGAAPVAQIYAGHQFGAYSARLGDGRALLLGELTDRAGHKRDLHLKGSGPTPFARADGFAALGPMLREYVLGEAMHALGIPTTRALAVVATGSRVMRDESLDPLPGAVLARTAASHVRVGTFQFVRSTGNTELLRRLADYVIARHYPRIADAQAPYAELLSAVVAAQARLTASWMLVGFVHGVMNTDNMTVAGETIDYGPCAFLDAYDPAAVFSSIDAAGRYAYGNQPGIARWNLTRFAESLLPLLHDDQDEAKEVALGAIAGFSDAYDCAWLAGMRAKLGVGKVPTDVLSDESVTQLAGDMLAELHRHRIDYTRFFRALADAARGDQRELRASYTVVDPGAPGPWLERWLAVAPDPDAMDEVNPVYIARNALLDEALDAASAGELAPVLRMLEAVTSPFTRRPGLERFESAGASGLRRHVTYCGT